MNTVFLVHGGLWDGMDADGFRHRPGSSAPYRTADPTISRLTRLPRATDKDDEARVPGAPA